MAPLATPGDRFVADGALDARGARARRDARDTPEPLENYGLTGEPTVRFPHRSGYVLRIGNATPVGGNVYATDAEGKRVFTLASWRKNAPRRR